MIRLLNQHIIKFASTFYPPEWKEVVRVKCLAQEHNNTMLPARAQGQTAQNRKEVKNQITGCLHRQIINFKMGNN